MQQSQRKKTYFDKKKYFEIEKGEQGSNYRKPGYEKSINI